MKVEEILMEWDFLLNVAVCQVSAGAIAALFLLLINVCARIVRTRPGEALSQPVK